MSHHIKAKLTVYEDHNHDIITQAFYTARSSTENDRALKSDESIRSREEI